MFFRGKFALSICKLFEGFFVLLFSISTAHFDSQWDLFKRKTGGTGGNLELLRIHLWPILVIANWHFLISIIFIFIQLLYDYCYKCVDLQGKDAFYYTENGEFLVEDTVHFIMPLVTIILAAVTVFMSAAIIMFICCCSDIQEEDDVSSKYMS